MLVNIAINAQTYQQTKSDSIIFKALNDEMDRSLNELQQNNDPKPFYISYTLSDIHNFSNSASFGAIEYSNFDHNRDWALRLIAGNYKINDENYIRSNRLPEQQTNRIALPLDDDYNGIRRSFWVATDAVYKRATANYLDKIKTIKENNLPDSVLIDDFSKEEKVIKLMAADSIHMDKNYYDQLVVECSGMFNKCPEIYSANVGVDITKAVSYFVSSEGAKIRIPNNSFDLYISATLQTSDGKYLPASINYHAIRNQDIPHKDSIIADVQLLITHLYNLEKAELFTDTYSGPVLISGPKTANLIKSEFFSGKNSLIASRNSLYSNFDGTLRYGNEKNKYAKKIGRKIGKTDISLTIKPTLSEYKNTGLIGTYYVDAEGVIPANELKLVEEGKLLTLLNDRTPSESIKNSTGNKRFYISGRNVSKRISPGNLFVNTKNNFSSNELKAKLIELATDEGLDYAIIYKPIKKGVDDYPVAYYKVNIESGEETLLRSASFSNNKTDLLKSIESFSNNEVIYNISGSGRGRGSSSPMSYIGPESVLFKFYNVQGKRQALSNSVPPVPMPTE